MKTIIERGASWTLEETKLLLSLWGQDHIARKDTTHKRTKEVYEKISEKFNQSGFERTPDQVRTRVFNMIAEYRRIIKDPTPEKKKKCIFFEAMHKIYKAQHWSEVKSLIDDDNPLSPDSNSKSCEALDESIQDGEALDGSHLDNSSMDASNASNSVSNNNNISAASSHSAQNNDTTNSATTNTTTNNSSSGAETNNKTSATSDNIANNSINDSHAAKKSFASLDSQQGAVTKKIRVESPRAGTSQGETNTTNADVNKNSANNVAGGLSAHNASNASTTVAPTNNAPTSSGKQQSLLATSTSSTSTPISKMTPSSNNSASYINIHSTKLPIIRNQYLGHSNGNESININGTQATTARLPTTAAITSHQLYQAPINTFDVTSSALLIDRMFSHLSRESENMREWIALEKDRIALEKARRAQETEREIRRERVLIDTLMKFHEQWISFVARLDPRLMEGSAAHIPELNIPPKEIESQQQVPSSQANESSSASLTKMNE
jgi:hypothetical protein